MQAIVLAGGLGTRLRAAVPDLPKPMAPVAGRPFLAWVLDRLGEAGCERAVLAVGYRHEPIRAYFGERYRDMALQYSVEDTPLGTGGAIRLAAEQVYEYPVCVLNGDTYLELDYRAMLEAHERARTSMSVAVCHVDDVSRYGALELEDGVIHAFLEKGRAGPGVINAGTYLLGAEVIARIPAGQAFSFEQQLLVPRVGEIRPTAFLAEGRFIDIGIPEDYARAQRLFSHA
ncbi:MAG: nucleotidyltransferase family protein [Thiobacillaceae bacterium]|jgi:D-glycero-alpha-D-manno-heptose 1-phosphate guanylyltransferase|nr:nucleotidyltransferase family protein [Thiobacillaceae bacterium]